MQSDNDSIAAMDQDIIATLPSAPPSSFQAQHLEELEQQQQQQQQQQHDASGQPIKVRKKPGRKPNPASPALRKAQNRAAQRAFRERKERHMRELEIAIKQIREQRDKLHVENEQLKADQEILRSENWYLKGIVLSLQLVCFQHNLVIPQHGPYINEQALSVLAKSIPETISAYINVNANNKLPIPSKLFGYRHTVKQRDRYLSSGSIVITKQGVHSLPDHSASHQNHQHQHAPSAAFSRSAPMAAPRGNASTHIALSSFSPEDKLSSTDTVHPLESPQQQPQQQHVDDETANMPPLSPGSVSSDKINNMQFGTDKMMPPLQPHTGSNVNSKATTQPVMLTEEPLTSNLAAIQTLRLRLRLQSACVRMDSIPFAIQPTLLQLTIPHDPRIDLIPTPHMRDRMILFRDQFDLDDCFRLLLGSSVFHGGDPGVAGNWQLPPEFFEKYWFLTIDYDLRRTTNHWRRLQGLSELNFKQKNGSEEEETKSVNSNGDSQKQPPLLEQIHQHNNNLSHTDLSALLGVDFWKLSQASLTKGNSEPTTNSSNSNGNGTGCGAANNETTSYASSLSSDGSYHSPVQTPGSPPTTTTMASANGASETTQKTSSSNDNKFEPVRLTNGYNYPYPSTQHHKSSAYSFYHRVPRHHPYQTPSPSNCGSSHKRLAETMTAPSSWTSLLDNGNALAASSSSLSSTNTSRNEQGMDITMSDLIDTEPEAF